MKYLTVFFVVSTVFLGVLTLTSDYERVKRQSKLSPSGTAWAQLR